MLTPEQRQKLQQAGYSAAQITAYEQQKFGGSAPGQVKMKDRTSTTESRPGFFADLGQDLSQTAQNIRSSVATAGQRQRTAMGASIDNEQTLGEGAFQAFGEGARGVSNVLGDVAIGVGKAVLPERAERAIGGAVMGAAERVTSNPTVSNFMSRWEQYKQTNPREARNLEATLGIGELAAEFIGGGVGAKGGKALTRAGSEVADTTLDTARRAGDTLQRGLTRTSRFAGDTTKDVAGFATAQITGLDPDTILTIVRDVDTFDDARRAGFNRMSIATDIENRLNARLDTLDNLGEQYNPIRESGDIVELPGNYIEEQIKKQGFIIKDGKVRANTKSPTRNTSDLNALQRLYDDWAGNTTLEADEFLNLRHDLSKLSKFGREVGSSNEVEAVTRGIRSDLNNYREQISGLRELDEKFAPERETLGRLKKELFDAEGNLKDSAVNRIANATGKGKDPLLNRLKELKPDIEERINILKAIENVEYSKGQAVGSYARSVVFAGLGGGAIFSGNLPMGLALLTLSSPETFIKAASFYGKRIMPTQEKLFNSIQKKLRQGAKLNQAESNAFAGFINMDKATAERVLQGIGAGVGVGATSAATQ